jgi:hypothetical protein
MKYDIKIKSQYSITYMLSLFIVVFKILNILFLLYIYPVIQVRFPILIKGFDILPYTVFIISLVLIIDSIDVFFYEKRFSSILDKFKGLSPRKRIYCKIVFFSYIIISLIAVGVIPLLKSLK